MTKGAKGTGSTVSSKKKRINGAKKGKAFERFVANAIGHIFPDAQRMLEYQSGGNIGVDLEETGRFKVQCKCYANYAPLSKIREVMNSGDDIPLLVTKGNRQAPIAALYFTDFIEILERAYGLKPLFDLVQPKDVVLKHEVKMLEEPSPFDLLL